MANRRWDRVGGSCGGVIHFELPLGGELKRFRLPAGVQRRLKELLDRQEGGQSLTAAERREAEGLVELAEMLSRLKQRAAKS